VVQSSGTTTPGTPRLLGVSESTGFIVYTWSMDSHTATAAAAQCTAPLRREWVLLLSVITTALFLLFGNGWMAHLAQPLWFTLLLAWLFGVIVASAFAVVRHAESLAVIFGEPVGTLILTLSAITIEVMMIAAVMLTGDSKPAVARDTMFAVVMIILNGMVGLSLLLGGWRYHEQTYNFYGANAFLGVIVPLAVLGLVLPNYTTASAGPTLSPFQSVFLAVMSVGLYSIFVTSQTSRYRAYFMAPGASREEAAQEVGHHQAPMELRSAPYHGVLLVLYLLPIALLAKHLAVPLDYGVRVIGAPPAVGGLLVAAVILSPESLSAVRAALANQMQRAVNILLGTALSTIGLTIPAVLTLGLVTGKTVVLGLDVVEMILLLLTLAVSTLTFTGNRTNFVQGAIHLLLFLAYLTLIFER
jgi:Ca2+:H+ antiporter